jgi:para-aminobenzoate synthetase
MRILLVDNYDSFTYNLFHLISAACEVEPTVIKNDDWQTWRALKLAGFDCAVISPGPGRPEKQADVGLSRVVCASGRLPVLGVCLGHQELCYANGATIRLADEPMHGRVSYVSHDGSGLFASIPSPYEAVRYHSLEVADVPKDLIVTATSPRKSGGDIVMAVEHRHRPLWGVQFHPESILTQYGEELMRNFLHLAKQAA